MHRKYKGWTLLQRRQEYARLKIFWCINRNYDEKAYDAFIARITRRLGV